MTTEPFTPLAGLRVLDLSRYLPGPYLTRVLCDLGAEVIKLESPVGDPVRAMPPMAGAHAAAFAALNWGKRSVVVDLKAPHGTEVALALAARSDVVVESFRPGVLARLGLDWTRLHALDPRIILCSISGYGQTGPLAHRAGHDVNYMARAGVLGLWGPSDGSPATPGVQIADVGGGALQAAVGILAALRERDRTGVGRHLDIALCRGLAPFLAMEVAQRSAGWRPTAGQGALNGGLPCYRVYPTGDGRAMALGALEPKFFSAFCRAAGVEHLDGKGLLPDPDVIAELEALFASRSQQEWVECFASADCCCEPVLTPEEALEDPGVAIPTVELATATAVATHVGVETRATQRHVPALGENSAAVLADLKVDVELVARARQSGALSDAESP